MNAPGRQSDVTPSPRFARRVFLSAGIYGLLVMPPMYLLEHRIGIDTPPPITHPEYFYGFIGVTIAWQVLFLCIARDPVTYRLLMLPCILEKLSFVPVVFFLVLEGRAGTQLLPFGLIDLVLAILFMLSYAKIRLPRSA